jgi:hypothetical protein
VVFLNNNIHEFFGGRVVFTNSYSKQPINTIQPRVGRVLIFSTGSENENYIEQIENGSSHFLTIHFTCHKTEGF